MNTRFNYILIIVLIQFVTAYAQNSPDEIDLSGKWQFKMDPQDQGVKEKWFDQDFTKTVVLPGSMVENDKGNPVGYDTKWLGSLVNKKWYEDPNYKPYLILLSQLSFVVFCIFYISFSLFMPYLHL